LYENGSTNMFTVASTSSNVVVVSSKLVELYKKYLVTTRSKPSYMHHSIGTYEQMYLVLKNGAEMGIMFYGVDSYATIFPGETNTVNTSAPYGVIFFDINGSDGPNIKGKDRFYVPLDKTGIKYD
jgi:hypothetical protein